MGKNRRLEFDLDWCIMKINQRNIKNKFIAYLKLQTAGKNYDLEYLEHLIKYLDGPHCSGFNALMVYHNFTGTENKLHAEFESISAWDERVDSLTPELTQVLDRLIGHVVILSSTPASAIIKPEEAKPLYFAGTFSQHLGIDEQIDQNDYHALYTVLGVDGKNVETIIGRDILFFVGFDQFNQFIKDIFTKLNKDCQVMVACNFKDHAVSLNFRKDADGKESLYYYCANVPNGQIEVTPETYDKMIASITESNVRGGFLPDGPFMLAVKFYGTTSAGNPLQSRDVCDNYHDFALHLANKEFTLYNMSRFRSDDLDYAYYLKLCRDTYNQSPIASWVLQNNNEEINKILESRAWIVPADETVPKIVFSGFDFGFQIPTPKEHDPLVFFLNLAITFNRAKSVECLLDYFVKNYPIADLQAALYSTNLGMSDVAKAILNRRDINDFSIANLIISKVPGALAQEDLDAFRARGDNVAIRFILEKGLCKQGDISPGSIPTTP